MMHPTILMLRVFIGAGTYLRSRCLVTIRGYTYRQRDWWERFMNYAVEIGLVVMMYIPSFIKIGSAIQKLIRGIHRYTDIETAW
jgi:hypothetical protein